MGKSWAKLEMGLRCCMYFTSIYGLFFFLVWILQRLEFLCSLCTERQKYLNNYFGKKTCPRMSKPIFAISESSPCASEYQISIKSAGGPRSLRNVLEMAKSFLVSRMLSARISVLLVGANFGKRTRARLTWFRAIGGNHEERVYIHAWGKRSKVSRVRAFLVSWASRYLPGSSSCTFHGDPAVKEEKRERVHWLRSHWLINPLHGAS